MNQWQCKSIEELAAGEQLWVMTRRIEEEFTTHWRTQIFSLFQYYFFQQQTLLTGEKHKIKVGRNT